MTIRAQWIIYMISFLNITFVNGKRPNLTRLKPEVFPGLQIFETISGTPYTIIHYTMTCGDILTSPKKLKPNVRGEREKTSNFIRSYSFPF